MSGLHVRVTTIKNLRPHPDPTVTKLELCEVFGWQMVVGKGLHVEGNKVVFFPPDTCIPDVWAEKWNVKNYLGSGNRVKMVRLKGEPSYGLAIRVEPENQDWEDDRDVADFYGATKYDPPIRPTSGDAEVAHPMFEKYTDIENMRNFPEIFVDGEEIVATEKIHGTNCRVGLVDGDEMAGSKDLRRKMPNGFQDIRANTYWFPMGNDAIKGCLHGVAEQRGAKQVILYGEVYGGSVQNLHYGIEKGKGLGFRAFDMLVDGKYLDYDDFVAITDQYKVERVPFVFRGAFSIAKVKELSDGKTLMGADHIREGVVIRPVKERINPKIGRVVLKYVGDSYLYKKESGKTTDFKDQ